MKAPLIVSRHPGAIDWLQQYFPWLRDAEVRESVTVSDVAGRVVVGNIPLFLAAECAAYYAIEFAGAPPRGAEYGVKEMVESGARLTCYRVERVG